ncbi:MAG: hypothetical protein ACE15F_09880 [bacterium]
MARNRWLWIGCGGCLGLVILLVLMVFAGGFAIHRYVKNIQNETDQWVQQVKALDQAHPFTPASPPSLDPPRYAEFLEIRYRSAASVDRNLGWLMELSQAAAASKEPESRLALVKKFINLPFNLFDIGEDQLNALTGARMSMREYVYLTQITAGALNEWRQREAGDARRAIAEAYLKPILDLDEILQKYKQNHPHTNIEIGPFDKDIFLQTLKNIPPPTPEMDGTIYAARDRIVSASSAALLDAITLQNAIELEKPPVSDAEASSAETAPTPGPSAPSAPLDSATGETR